MAPALFDPPNINPEGFLIPVARFESWWGHSKIAALNQAYLKAYIHLLATLKMLRPRFGQKTAFRCMNML